MGNLARALETMLSASSGQQSVAAATSDNLKTPHTVNTAGMNQVPPEQLYGMRLAYALFEAEREQILGSPSSAFAYFDAETDLLFILSESDKNIRHVSLENLTNYNALEQAKQEGASFVVHGQQVICNIRGFSSSGASYGEAALRTLLAYRRG